MLPQELIRQKRDGGELSAEQIGAFVRGLTDGSWTEGQIAAFAMAVLLRGMGTPERVELMCGLRDSGDVLDWSDLGGPTLDKHSTGGVGDNVSLILAPAIAALGGFVPMVSGRGLGHTGGTLDKLDSIPGYDTRPSLARFRSVVRNVGAAIVGQSAALAPADGRLYAIRDITATVESVDLICASILSKKLAAGISGLVLDVKSGSGAFMPGMQQARALAMVLGDTANRAGMRSSVLITDMDEPLASAAGNALEVRHAIDFLTGRSVEPRMKAVVLALGAELLRLGGLASSLDDAHLRLERVLADGAGAERFARMVAALGGPSDLIERPHQLQTAAVQREVLPEQDGYVADIDCRALGLAVVSLGGGRIATSDRVDPSVGFDRLASIGSRVDRRSPLARVHAPDDAKADAAAQALRAAYRIVPDLPTGERAVVRECMPRESFGFTT